MFITYDMWILFICVSVVNKWCNMGKLKWPKCCFSKMSSINSVLLLFGYLVSFSLLQCMSNRAVLKLTGRRGERERKKRWKHFERIRNRKAQWISDCCVCKKTNKWPIRKKQKIKPCVCVCVLDSSAHLQLPPRPSISNVKIKLRGREWRSERGHFSSPTHQPLGDTCPPKRPCLFSFAVLAKNF